MCWSLEEEVRLPDLLPDRRLIVCCERNTARRSAGTVQVFFCGGVEDHMRLERLVVDIFGRCWLVSPSMVWWSLASVRYTFIHGCEGEYLSQ